MTALRPIRADASFRKRERPRKRPPLPVPLFLRRRASTLRGMDAAYKQVTPMEFLLSPPQEERDGERRRSGHGLLIRRSTLRFNDSYEQGINLESFRP